MSRQRVRNILRRLEKIGRRDLNSESDVQILRDIADLHALHAELSSLLVERYQRKPKLTPAEVKLYRRMTGAGTR